MQRGLLNSSDLKPAGVFVLLLVVAIVAIRFASDGSSTVTRNRADRAIYSRPGETIAIIVSGDGGAMIPPPAQVFLTVDGLSTLPLAEYLEFRPPAAPSSVETIEDPDHIAFYSGGQKLAGAKGRSSQVALRHGPGPSFL